jgi:hypothetical protein
MRKLMLALAALGCLFWVAADVNGQLGGGKKGPMGFGGGGGFPGGFGPMASGPAKPTTWEYRVLTRSSLAQLGKDNLEAGLNELGAEGWELIGIETGAKSSSYSYIFRRPGTNKPRSDAKRAAEPAPKEKADASIEFRIYRLKHASAINVGRVIEELMRTGRQDSLRVVADPQTNQLLMKGPVQMHLDVEAILKCLDVPSDDASPPPGAFKKRESLPGKK